MKRERLEGLPVKRVDYPGEAPWEKEWRDYEIAHLGREKDNHPTNSGSLGGERK